MYILASIRDLADTIHRHRNENLKFAFKTPKMMSSTAPEAFHYISIVHAEDKKDPRVEVHWGHVSFPKVYRFAIASNMTPDAIYKKLIVYFNHYDLPSVVLAGDFNSQTVPAASEVKSCDVTPKPSESVKYATLNGTLLDLIIFIQRSQSYYCSRCNLLKESTNWFNEVKRDWNDIPSDLFRQAGIKKNIHNFEAMLYFEVTNEMMSSPAENLNRFKTPFYAKEE